MKQNKNSNTINKNDAEDILELEARIQNLKNGLEDEERFKLYRLTRGVYGQRQLGVQMFRIKIPFGKISSKQIIAVADISDKYASSNLHLTTRQDIQLHYVKLEDSPKVWTLLSKSGLTAREACGNTVRNITASPTSGVDPKESFDVSPYAQACTNYFLRNPICQEMGRKIKISFSNSQEDTAYSYFHDFGFIAKTITVNNKNKKGFEVYVGGGLGAVAMSAKLAFEFLPTDQLLPFLEASLRVFDRHGEREKRQKARLKFLIKKIGLDTFLDYVKTELKALNNQSIEISDTSNSTESPSEFISAENYKSKNVEKFAIWKVTNTFNQKQEGFVSAYIKVKLGDISSEDARKLAPILKKYTSDDIRITPNQNLLLRYIRKENLQQVYDELSAIGYADDGYDSPVDVTACPGTDTCNLGVTNSTGLAREIEKYIRLNYSQLVAEKDLKIKISGCMNACGQHMIADIGFHGSSIKKNELVVPAVQIVLGGGQYDDHPNFIAEKVIKLPTKKALEALGILIEDFNLQKTEEQNFHSYYWEKGKKYFYSLLKPLSDITQLSEKDLFDWEQDELYKQEIGVGECAGVILDVVGTIFKDASVKLKKAEQEFSKEKYAEAGYYSYTSQVITAKALLLSQDIKCNTQIGILNDFETTFIESEKLSLRPSFKDDILSIKSNKPSQAFVAAYINQAKLLLETAITFRNETLKGSNQDKIIIDSYYKA